MKGENMANWIWYPGDFEIYHGMCQNFDREERGFFWPAYWHIADCRHHVVFHASCRLEKETAFRVTAKGIGHVLVPGRTALLSGKKVYDRGMDFLSCKRNRD